MTALDQFESETLEDLSISFVTDVFTVCSGRSQIRINDSIAGFHSTRGEVFIHSLNSKTIWMPACHVLQCLTHEEISVLKLLPRWDGSNEYQISSQVLRIMGAAISRYLGHKKRDEDSEGRWFKETITNGHARREYL